MKRSWPVVVALALLASLAGGWLAAAAPPAGTPAEAPAPTVSPSTPEPPAWDREISDVISPGPLARAHLDSEGVTHCNDCHSWLGGTPDSSCLACHEEIGERRAGRLGFHGGFEGRCAGCHADHRGREADLLGLDRDGFAHDQALFPLRGAHADVACDDCHLREDPDDGSDASPRVFHAIGIARDCTGCHESPHAERLVRERDCEACHVAVAWDAPAPRDAPEAFGFDHDADTRFPLDARHASLACNACHRSGVTEPPARECARCHTDAAALLAGRFGGRKLEPDPHATTTTCAECHPARPGRSTLFEYAAVCTDCHPASYAPLLATRRALLDEALVAARLATSREADRRRLEVLARSGLHHAELAEALALELAEALALELARPGK